MAVLLSTGTDHVLRGPNGAQGSCGACRTVGTEAARRQQLLRHRHICQEGDLPGLHMARKEGQEGNATCLGAAGRAEGRCPCPVKH